MTSETIKAAFSTRCKLETKYKSSVGSGVTTAATKYKVTLSTEGVDLSDHEYMGGKSIRFGNRPLAENSLIKYELLFRQYWRYAAMTGAYSSMLMLLKKPPAHCPSMDVNSLESFVRFKCLELNKPLLDLCGQPILDIHKTAMTSEGSWKAPKNMDHFRAAINDLHAANGHTAADYSDACEQCLALPDICRHLGCQNHTAKPQLYRLGNPTRHSVFTNTVKNMVRLAESAGYEEKGCSQLLPYDLRMLRANLLSTNSIIDLQMFVIAICATKLAYRHDEFHKLSSDLFLPEYFEIDDNRIDALAIKVKGKCDKTWIPFKLHADHMHTDLCPLRPLLVYMHILGIKGGFLFPTEEEIKNPPQDRIYKTVVCYQKFLLDFKKKCLAVLDLDQRPDFKIGVHVFRKTFYLLGVFGDAPEMELKESARHKSMDSSFCYRQAALVLYQQHKNRPIPSCNVSKWKAIKIDSRSGGNARMMLSLSGCKILEFNALSNFFVRTLLQIGPSNPFNNNARHLLCLADSFVRAAPPCELFSEYLAKLHPNVADELQGVVNGMIRDSLKAQQMQNNAIATATTGLLLPMPPAPTIDEAPEPPKKKARLVNDLPGRHELKQMESTEDKIDMMKKLFTEYNDKGHVPLSKGASSFVSKFLNPVMNCLKNHFHGDKTIFLNAYPTFKHTTFASQFCNGKGTQCSPALQK